MILSIGNTKMMSLTVIQLGKVTIVSAAQEMDRKIGKGLIWTLQICIQWPRNMRPDWLESVDWLIGVSLSNCNSLHCKLQSISFHHFHCQQNDPFFLFFFCHADFNGVLLCLSRRHGEDDHVSKGEIQQYTYICCWKWWDNYSCRISRHAILTMWGSFGFAISSHIFQKLLSHVMILRNSHRWYS